MFKSYFKTAIRNLLRYKGFAFINIISLAIGITGCLLICLFVWDELKYDKFIQHGDNIYRIYQQTTNNNGTTSAAVTPPAFATYLKANYPEVEESARLLMWSGRMLMEVGDQKGYEEKGFVADSNFFKIFPLKFSNGSPDKVLNDPTALVITDELARRYFGDADPIGKAVKLDKINFVVKGVLAKLPEHFHLDFNYIFPMSGAGIPAERMQRWGWTQFYTYVKLKEGHNLIGLQVKFADVVKKETREDFLESGTFNIPFFQKLTDVHLYSSEFVYDNAKRGNASYLKGLTIIALFVLIIGCFNFINLATARSFRRAKEIGIRKVVGAERRQLVVQFLLETLLVSLIAMSIAVIATVLILPALNSFTDKSISFNPITNPLLALLIIGIGLLIGALSGIYPSLVMSGFQPIKVLKGLKPMGSGLNVAATLRQGLVIAQFSLSVLLIISAVFVYKQMRFLNEKDLGFNKDQILFFDVRSGIAKNEQVFKDELKRSANVVGVTGGYGLPGDQLATDGIMVPSVSGDDDKPAIQILVDHDYLKTMGLRLVAGRDFSKDLKTDAEEAFIINETAVKQLGLGSSPQEALGKTLHWNKWEPDSLNPVKKGKVIGVVKDFHVKSLHEKVATTVLHIYPPALAKIAVKVRPENLPATIDFIKTTWNKFSPDFPLEYKFLDENFDAMYNAENKLSTLLWIFTAMAIFVGCMGLFGLAAFSAEQRLKEIGIRKVLGASGLNIVSMLCKIFLKPIFISCLISFPIAWWVMNNWLQDFEYRTTISWWVFVIAAVAACVIALLTVSFHTIKAAVSNPVKSLRTN